MGSDSWVADSTKLLELAADLVMLGGAVEAVKTASTFLTADISLLVEEAQIIRPPVTKSNVINTTRSIVCSVLITKITGTTRPYKAIRVSLNHPVVSS